MSKSIKKTKRNSGEWLQLLFNMLAETTPYPYDVNMQQFMPENGAFDVIGNYILTIGESETLFCCHVDTVGSKVQKTNPIYHKGWIYAKGNSCCLGGDDKCGVLCLLALIEAGIPGTYVFHVGEESGCVGANFLEKSNFPFSKFKRCIEFDRRGTNSVITNMSMTATCSMTFAKALCEDLDLSFVPDDTGIFTDNYNYCSIIPEITNLSVGFFDEHTSKEKINADWLIEEFIPALLNVDWENLPTERDPSAPEYSSWKYRSHSAWFHSMYDEYDFGTQQTADGFIQMTAAADPDTYIIEPDGTSVQVSDLCGHVCDFCETDVGPFDKVQVFDGEYWLCTYCVDLLLDCYSDNPESEKDEVIEEVWNRLFAEANYNEYSS